MKRPLMNLKGVAVAVLMVCLFPLGSNADADFEEMTLSKKVSTQDLQTQNAEGQRSFADAAQIQICRFFGQSSTHKKVSRTIITIVFSYLLIFILVGNVNRRVANVKARHVLRKNIIYVVNILLIFIILVIWIQNISSLTIFLGVASAGMALALQEALLCMAGWFLIVLKRPFEVGDRIEISGIKGDVIDIRLFQTSLLEIGNWVEADHSTGRIANIPNSAVFKKETFNYNKGFEFIWNEIRILITFESDWRKGREVILCHAQKLAHGQEVDVKKKIDRLTNRYMIFYEKLGPNVYVNIKDSGVELTLRYLTEAKKRRFTQDQLCQAILSDFEKEEHINFAYPTYRIVKT